MSPEIQPYNYSLKIYVKDIGMPHLTIVYPFACEFSTLELLPYQTTTTWVYLFFHLETVIRP